MDKAGKTNGRTDKTDRTGGTNDRTDKTGKTGETNERTDETGETDETDEKTDKTDRTGETDGRTDTTGKTGESDERTDKTNKTGETDENKEDKAAAHVIQQHPDLSQEQAETHSWSCLMMDTPTRMETRPDKWRTKHVRRTSTSRSMRNDGMSRRWTSSSDVC
jgi:hypothetical protein